MAARLRKTRQDEVRDKIKSSQLINRLQDHAFGKTELSNSQIKAIDVLLRKCVPDLSQVQINNAPGETFSINISTESEKCAKGSETTGTE